MVCPQGNVSRSWKPERRPNGKPTIQVQFSRAECRACPARPQCTRNQSGPRELILNLQAEHQAIQAARERQKTQDFKRQYAQRAGIEGTLSQSAFALDMRRSRYRGLERTHLQHVFTASAINLLPCLRLAGRDPTDKDTEVAFCRTDGCLMISPTTSR